MAFLRRNAASIALLLLVAVAVYLFFYCPAVFDFVLKPSEREVYERDLSEADRELWVDLKNVALGDQVLLKDPFVEHIIAFDSASFSAGYKVYVAQGESLKATIQLDSLSSNWFLEAYSLEGTLLKTSRRSDSLLILEGVSRVNDTVRVVVQSKLNQNVKGELKIFMQPLLQFPLPGKSNLAIKSFWGVARDGGRRSHEGNDIFADRGYPVIAAADGRISSVRNKGLGGKQIWLRDESTSSSHYYAHLDSQLVTSGQRVSRGDTIGLVGNTGNARTTPPHLHFGIYKTGGAVDPKPYIWQIPIPQSSTNLPLAKRAIAVGSEANLRQRPNASSKVLQNIQNDTLTILGTSNDWYHVRTANNVAGFAHRSVIQLVN